MTRSIDRNLDLWRCILILSCSSDAATRCPETWRLLSDEQCAGSSPDLCVIAVLDTPPQIQTVQLNTVCARFVSVSRSTMEGNLRTISGRQVISHRPHSRP